MAKITLGIGMSHTPRLVSEPEDWLHFDSFGDGMGGFLDVDGVWITGNELKAKYGNTYADQATMLIWKERYAMARKAIERLAVSVSEAKIDVMIVLGDDQHELLDKRNYPAVHVFTGEAFQMVDLKARAVRRSTGAFPDNVRQRIAKGWYMDGPHTYPNHRPLANEIVKQMLAGGMTPSIAEENQTDPTFGYGHGIGIVIQQLLEVQKDRDHQIPLIPILLNTYFPPNQPTPAICWQVGQAIKRAVSELPDDLNVGVLASGGISHFVVNEEWDREMMALMREGDEAKLMNIPIPMLQSGNSEMLNWISLVSACQHLETQWDMYTPIYSQPHREGVGFGFMEWH